MSPVQKTLPKNVIHLVIVMSLFISEADGQCQMRDQCSCINPDGSIIDLSSLGKQDQTPAFADIFAQDGYFYSYNPCYPFIEGTCANAAGCQISGDQSAQYVLGEASSAQFSFDGTINHITYSATDGTGLTRTLDVQLQCDQNADPPQFAALGETGSLLYSMAIVTKCACPNGCTGGPQPTQPTPNPTGPQPRKGDDSGGGISVGTVLCIVALALCFVYIVAGTAINVGYRKQSGREAVPNVTFWTALPGQIKDGFKFTFSKCRSGYGKI